MDTNDFFLRPSTINEINQRVRRTEEDGSDEKLNLEAFVAQNYYLEPDPWWVNDDNLLSPLSENDNENLELFVRTEIQEIRRALYYLLRPFASILETCESNYVVFQEFTNAFPSLYGEEEDDKCKSALKMVNILGQSYQGIKKRTTDGLTIFNYLEGIITSKIKSILSKLSEKVKSEEDNYETDDEDFLDDIILDEDNIQDPSNDISDYLDLKFCGGGDDDDQVDKALNVEQLKCTPCDEFFTDEGELKFHFKTAHPKTTVCHICNDVFKTLEDFKDHLKDAHDGINELQCHICQKIFTRRRFVVRHLATVHTFTSRCEMCGESFLNGFKLKSHMAKEHKTPKSVEETTCHICGKFFSGRSNLKSHIKFVHERVFKEMCHLCGKKYEMKFQLRKHILCAHEGGKPFSCELCPKAFTKRESLRHHISIIHEGIVKQFKCDKCGQEYSYKNALNSHMHAAHEDAAYPCDICGKTFKRKCTVKEHQKLVHFKVKTIVVKANPCKYCDRSYGHKDNLRKHMKKIHPEFLDK